MVRNSGCWPRNPSPNSSKMTNGPRMRLAMSRGCRRTPISSFVKNPIVLIRPRNRLLNTLDTTLLDEPHEDFVKIRPILLDLLHLDPALLQHLQHAGDGDARFI